MTISENKNRCFGNKPGQEYYADYHDDEWGIPVHDDKHLFEMLISEGAQDFDLHKVARMSDAQLEALRKNPEIIRNRLKIYATRTN